MKKSAGILVYKFINKECIVLLVHPGGPFWKNKDEGAWSIPKGEFNEEDPLEAAKREFREETGQLIKGDLKQLIPVKQSSGKMIFAWMVEGDVDIDKIKSNEIPIEWPPRSGKKILVPEIDRAAWFELEEAKIKILKGQVNLLNQLQQAVTFKLGS